MFFSDSFILWLVITRSLSVSFLTLLSVSMSFEFWKDFYYCIIDHNKNYEVEREQCDSMTSSPLASLCICSKYSGNSCRREVLLTQLTSES